MTNPMGDNGGRKSPSWQRRKRKLGEAGAMPRSPSVGALWRSMNRDNGSGEFSPSAWIAAMALGSTVVPVVYFVLVVVFSVTTRTPTMTQATTTITTTRKLVRTTATNPRERLGKENALERHGRPVSVEGLEDMRVLGYQSRPRVLGYYFGVMSSSSSSSSSSLLSLRNASSASPWGSSLLATRVEGVERLESHLQRTDLRNRYVSNDIYRAKPQMSLLDSDDYEDRRGDEYPEGCVAQYEWQEIINPTCNPVHEVPLVALLSTPVPQTVQGEEEAEEEEVVAEEKEHKQETPESGNKEEVASNKQNEKEKENEIDAKEEEVAKEKEEEKGKETEKENADTSTKKQQQQQQAHQTQRQKPTHNKDQPKANGETHKDPPPRQRRRLSTEQQDASIRFVPAATMVGSGYWRDVWAVADDGDHEDWVVLKTMRYRHDYEERNYKRHERDAIAADRLTSSPRVLNIYSFCGNSGLYEYGNGGDLYEALFPDQKHAIGILNPREGRLATPLDRLRVAWQVAGAVADVHTSEGTDAPPAVVHADISPEQFIWKNGAYRLNDFNRCRFLTRRPANSTDDDFVTLCGFEVGRNPGHFRAPEEYAYEMETEKIDVYSLGNILYGLLTGWWPFELLDSSEAAKRVKTGVRPSVASEITASEDPAVQALLHAMKMCFVQSAEERASAREVEEYLQSQLMALEHGQYKEAKTKE